MTDSHQTLHAYMQRMFIFTYLQTFLYPSNSFALGPENLDGRNGLIAVFAY